MIFQSLIKKKEQGCGLTKERILRDGKGYDLTCIPQQLCESCSAQLSLLKTLQKEVEEVLEVWVIKNRTSPLWLEKRGLRNAEREGACIFLNSGERDVVDELKKSLENVGVKE